MVTTEEDNDQTVSAKAIHLMIGPCITRGKLVTKLLFHFPLVKIRKSTLFSKLVNNDLISKK